MEFYKLKFSQEHDWLWIKHNNNVVAMLISTETKYTTGAFIAREYLNVSKPIGYTPKTLYKLPKLSLDWILKEEIRDNCNAVPFLKEFLMQLCKKA